MIDKSNKPSKCKHGNTKIINVDYKDKTEKRFFPCYCKIHEDGNIESCNHNWINDPMFENGAVEMFTSMQGEEMRQYCSLCNKVRFIPKQQKESSDA